MSRWPVIAAILYAVCWPHRAGAQTTVDGSAEWSLIDNAARSNDQSTRNSAIWQNYAFGVSSPVWDPRLVKLNAQGLFRTSTLSSGGSLQEDQRGRQGDLGYKLGASVLSASAFPLFVQASRTTSTSSGDLGPSNPIRSGMIAPSGAPPVDFESRNKTLSIGWQFNLGRLPRVELGYRQGQALVTGGGYSAEQRDEDLSTAVFKDTARTHHAFRFQRTAFENRLAQTYVQRLGNLDYDLGVLLTGRTRFTAHGGHRTSFAQSEFGSVAPDTDTGAYAPPSTQGAAGAEYALAGIDYQPGRRFSVQVNGTIDRQIGDMAATSSRLATASSRLEVVPGLTLTASGTSGSRGEVIRDEPITAIIHSGVAGATYQLNAGWFSGSVSGTRGRGTNATREGATGQTDSWSREASVSTSFTWLGLGAGYERSRSRDGILELGNYDTERVRASAQSGTGRFTLSASGDQVWVERGVSTLFVRTRQRTFSGTASLRLWRESQVSGLAGGFVNDYAGEVGEGRDRTLFWGASSQVVLRSALRLSIWIRSEAAAASRTGFDQRGVSSFARLEYRFRALSLGAEYRTNQGRLRYSDVPNADEVRGRQLRVSIIRQFGARLR